MENCYQRTSRCCAIYPDEPSSRILNWAAIAICLGGFLYALTGFISTAAPKTLVGAPLAPLQTNQPGITGSTFAVDALPNLGRPSYLKGPVALYGSFLAGSGDSTGSVVSAIYPAVPDFYMFVSGYPNRPGNRLLLEVETSDHHKIIQRVAPFEDTGGKWLLKRISLRAIEGARSFRILATDANKGPEGWLGFSLPFLDRQSGGRTGLLIAKQIWFMLLAISASMASLWAPGLMLRREWQRVHQRLFSAVWIPVPGLLALAVLGLAAWIGIDNTGIGNIGTYQVRPDLLCRVPLMIFCAIAAVYFFRVRLSSSVTVSEMRLLAVTLAVIAIAAGKSMYSLGPAGELFHQEISHTLEIGGRSDSRLPYYVTQLVGEHQLPASPFARELYGTWTFSDRGQLAALAAAPLVLAGPTSIPDHKPEDAWTVFDPQGFTAYRCAMIVFATSALFFAYGVSQLFLPDGWALLACLVTATSPFFIHETYFTWPKLEAAAFVLLAGYLVLRSRFLLAGLTLGLGYMCHPSALLSTPAILCLLLLLPPRTGTAPAGIAPAAFWRSALQLTGRAALVMIGLAFWLVLWRLVNQANYTQTQFLDFASASGHLARTPANWLKFRFDSLLDTLLPLNQFFFHATDENVNAVEGPSPAIVRFFVQPWSTVPAGAGFLYFFCLLRLVYLAAVRRPGWTLALLAIPLLAFTAYMGIDRSGMLKEGLHAWFITLMIFSVVMWWQARRQTRWFWRVCEFALLTRAIDLVGMMILPVVWTEHAIVEPPFVLSDVVALVLMAGGVTWLCWYAYRWAEKLRAEEGDKCSP